MEFDRFNYSYVTFINIVRGIDRWLCVIWLTSHRNRNTQFFMEFIIISLFSDTPLWAKMRSSFHIMTSSHFASQWRHNERDGVSIHDCLPNRLFRHTWKKPSKLRVTGLCEGNSPVTGEFPTQRASNAENASICWRHHGYSLQRLPVANNKPTRRRPSIKRYSGNSWTSTLRRGPLTTPAATRPSSASTCPIHMCPGR